MNALLIDFGSTYTKLRAVSLDPLGVAAAGQGPSTVTTDITEGMNAALNDLSARLDGTPVFEHRLACSSAAGGLRMVTVGLVRELTAEAARQAALGAGARLVGALVQKLNTSDVTKIELLKPDIVLLAGGTDGGNSEVVLHNARALAAAAIDCPVIFAGNRAAADEAQSMLERGKKTVMVTENVMPEFGALNTDPAREVIRQVFIDRIVHAKGIDRAADFFDRVLMPTPAAVLEGARLLSEGYGSESGLGPLLVVDVGGATTDVHSVASGDPEQPGVIRRGLPEPYQKRTVEGDLGMRHNAEGVLKEAGIDWIAAVSDLEPARVESIVARLSKKADHLPAHEDEQSVDHALGYAAVRIAVRRHAGSIETVYTVNGPATVQRGKDLTGIRTIIGTGGVLAHAADPAGILRAALAEENDPLSLRPRRPRLLLDKDYLLYAVGLLGSIAPEEAVRLGKTRLTEIQEENSHGRDSIASG